MIFIAELEAEFKLSQLVCLQHSHSNEFFIRKAIGWALLEFVPSKNLKPLSKKEALKNI